MKQSIQNDKVPIYQSKRAILWFAHGSSMQEWRQPFDRMLHIFQKNYPEIPMALAFLETCTPTFPLAVNALCKTHSQLVRIDIVPLFLAYSVHTIRDIPALIKEWQANNETSSSIQFKIQPTLLSHHTFEHMLQQWLAHQYIISEAQ